MSAVLFQGDDSGYIRWLKKHPSGYVVNIRSRLDPGYVVLHRAVCSSISQYPTMDRNPGGFTERSYQKICGLSISEINALLSDVFKGLYSITSFNCRCLLEKHEQ